MRTSWCIYAETADTMSFAWCGGQEDLTVMKMLLWAKGRVFVPVET
jgi:hypothetical protein